MAFHAVQCNPAAPGIKSNSWTSQARRAGNAGIYDSVHYRNSTEVGVDMGRQVGALAVAKYLRAP